MVVSADVVLNITSARANRKSHYSGGPLVRYKWSSKLSYEGNIYGCWKHLYRPRCINFFFLSLSRSRVNAVRLCATYESHQKLIFQPSSPENQNEYGWPGFSGSNGFGVSSREGFVKMINNFAFSGQVVSRRSKNVFGHSICNAMNVMRRVNSRSRDIFHRFHYSGKSVTLYRHRNYNCVVLSWNHYCFTSHSSTSRTRQSTFGVWSPKYLHRR